MHPVIRQAFDHALGWKWHHHLKPCLMLIGQWWIKNGDKKEIATERVFFCCCWTHYIGWTVEHGDKEEITAIISTQTWGKVHYWKHKQGGYIQRVFFIRPRSDRIGLPWGRGNLGNAQNKRCFLLGRLRLLRVDWYDPGVRRKMLSALNRCKGLRYLFKLKVVKVVNRCWNLSTAK